VIGSRILRIPKRTIKGPKLFSAMKLRMILCFAFGIRTSCEVQKLISLRNQIGVYLIIVDDSDRSFSIKSQQETEANKKTNLIEIPYLLGQR
jgi:hypothetical protein